MFTAAYWKTTLEWTVVAGASAFLATWAGTSTPSLADLRNAGIAAGWAAIYAFVKQLGGVQAMTQTLKVKVGRHSK